MLHAMLEGRHTSSLYSENLKELVPKSLRVGVLVYRILPVMAESNSASSDLVPTKSGILPPPILKRSLSLLQHHSSMGMYWASLSFPQTSNDMMYS